MPDSPTVAVIGAGNVGCALAADLRLRGLNVHLFNRSRPRLEAIRAAGGITVAGELEGFAQLDLITDSLKEAIDGADIVAVTLPTATLPNYAGALTATVSTEQLVWLNPGHSGGALYLRDQFRLAGVGEPRLCQLTTASHVSRMIGPAEVRTFLLPRAAVAALPADHLDDCHRELDTLFPGRFGKASSILEVDLANINALMHPPGMICNAGWIEATSGGFGFYADGTRETVSKVIEAVDQERLVLARLLGVGAVPFVELFHQLGFTPGETGPATTVFQAIQRSELIRPIQSPRLLDHRYLHEDVGWGLVPWMELARAVGCPAPAITALTHLAGLVNGVDYTKEGLTLEAMGLARMSPDEILKYIGAQSIQRK